MFQNLWQTITSNIKCIQFIQVRRKFKYLNFTIKDLPNMKFPDSSSSNCPILLSIPLQNEENPIIVL